jgi:two-component sensor histidine kinase
VIPAKLTTKKIALGYSVWWSLWALLQAYAIVNTVGLSWRVALTDAVNTNLILASCGYVLCNALRWYRPSPKNSFLIFVWSIALTIVSLVIQRFITTKYLLSDEPGYQAFFVNSFLLRGLFSWLMLGFIAVLSWIWFYILEQQASEQRQEDAANLAREAELSKLRLQLQPHFLFNSLNSISALAGSRPEEARKMIQQLSDFLRGTLKKDDQQLVSFDEELEHLQLYLEIEKVRFGHRLKTVIERDKLTDNMTLPSLLLQPIVENAIKFGLYDTIGAITIRLSAKMDNGYLLIEVENPFDPETTQPKGTGFGLNSVQRRLYLLYARNDLLSTRQHENIFTTLVKIPQAV